MRVHFLLVLPLLALALAGSVHPARAQSLADAARKESERRKAVKDTAKPITNKDLPDVLAKPAPQVDTAQSGKDASADAKAKSADGTDKDKDDGKPKDQKYWGDRMKALQTALSRDEAFSGALQVQIDSLTTDFVNRDDPAQRGVIEQNRQKALDEQARLKQTVADDKKAIADLQEEARHAGAPPGWLR